ncbi:hypothetical protein ARMGADRAFT_119446 [Armillaria gallica]|uniref:Uncharacterized protein n=1 Tax=Armillaria gallica TaxID=47427 RepID=A0A2H3CWA3_ARMGA|nr:hypothetical protein ARMGADRAFT_119446 [Armillaria gallica]
MSRAAMSLESFQARVRHLFIFVSPLLRRVYSSWEDERFYSRSTSRYPLCLSTTSWSMNTGSRNDFMLLHSTIARPQRVVVVAAVSNPPYAIPQSTTDTFTSEASDNSSDSPPTTSSIGQANSGNHFQPATSYFRRRRSPVRSH